MPEPLTDREWWLACRVQQRTLRAVVDHCKESGWPGRVVAEGMLEGANKQFADAYGGEPTLRSAVEALLKEYKPNG